MDKEYIVFGKVLSKFGIGGDFSFAIYSSDKEEIFSFSSFYIKYKDEYFLLPIVNVRFVASKLLARIEGIVPAFLGDEKLGLVGSLIYIKRSELPKLSSTVVYSSPTSRISREYYHCDLIGLECFDDSGFLFGMVIGIANFGAGDLFEIEDTRPKAKVKRNRKGRYVIKRLYIPFSRELVKDICLSRRVVYFNDLEGFI